MVQIIMVFAKSVDVFFLILWHKHNAKAIKKFASFAFLRNTALACSASVRVKVLLTLQ